MSSFSDIYLLLHVLRTLCPTSTTTSSPPLPPPLLHFPLKSKRRPKRNRSQNMATTSRPRAPRIVTACIYAAAVLCVTVCLLSSSQGALAAPVRPTLPLPLLLPSTLPSTRPREQQTEQREEREDRLNATLPVPHKDNHRPLIITAVPSLPAPAVPTLPTDLKLPAVANTTTHHSDETFQVGRVNVQAQVKTPANATEEEKKAALVEALRGAVGMLLRSQNATASSPSPSPSPATDANAAEKMPKKRHLQKEDQPNQQKNATMVERIANILMLHGDGVPTGINQHNHTAGGGGVAITTIDGRRTTLDGLATVSDKERKRKEKEDSEQKNAMEKLREAWRNFNQIKSHSRSKSLSKRQDTPTFAKKVALLQDALSKLSDTTANSTDTIADSTLSNLSNLSNLTTLNNNNLNPNPTTTEPNATAAAATDAKSAILQLAAAANNVRNSKKKDEVVNAVKAVKAVAAAATGDLEFEFWKKVIGILDDILG
ncbi:hypothetical protein IWX90DRAFT_202159 [Phyllosticta citrichinensis]|uniref:Uncharacterized protein n=1 Tax=Phyllosticta citrichinensis TaxID=1130410 RepID=A0ABR1XXR9_9PEZI